MRYLRSTQFIVLLTFGLVYAIGMAGCGGGRVSDPTPKSYTITDLDPNVTPIKINNRGQIIGAMWMGDGNLHPIVIDNGQVTDLGTGPDLNGVVAINDMGQVVGNSLRNDQGALQPFIFDSGHFMAVGPTSGGYGTDINNAGQVVGWSEGTFGIGVYSWIWRNGVTTNLNPLPGDNDSQAVAINNFGSAIGISYFGGPCPPGCPIDTDPHRVIWRNGIPREIVVNGTSHTHTTPNAINDQDQVVGPTDDGHGYLWTRGTVKMLAVAGVEMQYPAAINFRGQVVGNSYIASDLVNPSHASLFSGGRIIDLNDMIRDHAGWQLREAIDINDAGEILVHGSIDSHDHWFLMKPQ